MRKPSNPIGDVAPLGKVPAAYFADKTPRAYRFHIFEDLLKAGGTVARAYAPSRDRAWLEGLVSDSPAAAIYVHVPWCVEECTYCHYWGKMEKRAQMEELCQAERRHATLLDQRIGLREKVIPSIYFGGGTPTVLPTDLLEQQLAFFCGYELDPEAEVCVEASVGTLTAAKLDVLERYATRISMGVQSFSDRLLERVARTFSRAKAIEVLTEAIRRFPAVNIDLIYGFERQTLAEWLESIETAIALETPSVTLYRLEVREEPPLLKAYLADPAAFPDEAACRTMRARGKRLLEEAGYRENLVGWFLKPKVKDTRVYRERWEKQTPCVAFGPGVQNYGSDHFHLNLDDRDAYLARLAQDEHPVGQLYEVGAEARFGIWVMAQLKSNRPIDLAAAQARFGEPPPGFAPFVRRLVDWELMTRGGDVLTLSDPGREILEWVLRDFIKEVYGDEHKAAAKGPKLYELRV